MPKVNMVELLKKAKEEKYAVPLINIDTLEWLHAVMDTAQRLQSPIIIGTAPFQVERLGGVHTVVGMIDGLVKKIERELGYPTTKIATGGLQELITPYAETPFIIEKDILLYGLYKIYLKNRG